MIAKAAWPEGPILIEIEIRWRDIQAYVERQFPLKVGTHLFMAPMQFQFQ